MLLIVVNITYLCYSWLRNTHLLNLPLVNRYMCRIVVHVPFLKVYPETVALLYACFILAEAH